MTPNDLLTILAQEMGIEKSKLESESNWKQRIILSTCSVWLLNLLRRNEDHYLSIVNIKDKVHEKLTAYIELFTLSSYNTLFQTEDIIKYLYETHESAGSFYHLPYNILPAREKHNFAFGVEWVRSPLIPKKYTYSGLGAYSLCEYTEKDKNNLYATYGLPSDNPQEIMKKILKRKKWRQFNDSSTREYLHIFRRFGDGYYTNSRPITNDIIISREQYDYGYRYMLVNNEIQYDLQDWEQEEFYQEYIALALINKYQKLQANVIVDDKLINLELNYALPVPEEIFLRLYAWPCSFEKLKDRWHFSITPVIYPAIKKRLSFLGFELREEYL